MTTKAPYTLINAATSSATPRFGGVTVSYNSQTWTEYDLGQFAYAEVELDASSLNTGDGSENNIADIGTNLAVENSIVSAEVIIEESTLLNPSSGELVYLRSFPSSNSILQLQDELGDAYTYNSGLFNSSGVLKFNIFYRKS